MSKKRILGFRALAILLCAAMCLGFAMPAGAETAEVVEAVAYGFCGRLQNSNPGENVRWTIMSDGGLFIYGSGAMMDYDSGAWAPQWLNMHYNPTGMKVTYVKISGNVTNVGKHAFANLNSLENVYIECPIEKIDNGAFSNCKNLSSVNFSLMSSECIIGESAFYGCSSLSTLSIPGGKEISSHAFAECTSLEWVDLPESLVEIGAWAFSGCSSLNDVFLSTYNSSVRTIGAYAFSGCSSLKAISIPDSVESIQNAAFEHCTSLKNVRLPKNLTTIAPQLFYGCISLEEIILPESVKYIGDAPCETYVDLGRAGAFQNCTALKQVSIPTAIEMVGGGEFYGCTSLENVWIESQSSNGCIIYQSAFEGCTSLSCVTLVGSITEIHTAAFKNCTALTYIGIPDSVKELGSNAFRGCASLREAYLSNSITRIRENTFVGCEKLEWISIGSRTVEIGENAFRDCVGIQEITIPKSVRIVNDYAFDGCTGLKEVFYLGKESNWENIIIWGYNDPLINAKIHYLADDPEAIIGSGYCGEGGEGTNLSWTLTYGGTITISGQGRMEDFPRGPGWMGDVFDLRYRVDRKRAVIEEGVTNISEYAFYGGPDDISTISIPKSVTEIGNHAIQDQLTDVYYNGTEEDWQSVVIGEGNSGLLQTTFHFLGKTEVTPTPTPTTAPKPTVTTTPTATPKPTATPTPVPTATPSPKPTATPVPTAKPSPTPVPAWKNPFADVKRYDWFYGAVEFVNAKGIMLGDPSGRFNPEAKLTRAEIAQMLYNIEGDPVKSLSHFEDVSADKWYAKAVNWVFEIGIISGYTDGTFHPERTATREELIAVIYRYAIYKGYNVAEGLKANADGFADDGKISSWAKTAMNWAIGEEIIGGKPGTIIDPKGTATRAETAQIFMGLLKER